MRDEVVAAHDLSASAREFSGDGYEVVSGPVAEREGSWELAAAQIVRDVGSVRSSVCGLGDATVVSCRRGCLSREARRAKRLGGHGGAARRRDHPSP